MLTNPLAPVVELWLTFFNALPLPFRTFLGLSLGLLLVTSLLAIAWKIK